jgi:lipase ATG15
MFVSWVLSELGSINNVELRGQGIKLINAVGNLTDSAKNQALFNRARTSEVMGKVTRARSLRRWMWVFGLFATVILFLSLLAASSQETQPKSGTGPIAVLDDFYYPPQPDMAYPTCKLSKGFSLPGQEFSYLVDFAWLARITYEPPIAAQYVLDKWFGQENAVVDETEFVAQYRAQSDSADNPLYHKLFSIPSVPGVGVVAVRGTEKPVDFLIDAQLWLSSGMVQIVRLIIPFAWIWNPILDDVVGVINSVESDLLGRIGYYRVTTAFVNDLLENNYTYEGKSFHTLRLTGHSLGGGVAMVTAAQTKGDALAVGISGVNSVLARHTFVPPLTLEALNTRVFNVIPDRDLIARVGDHARLFQELGCRAPSNSLFGCHDAGRTICELLYTCGSDPRPVLCWCAEEFGYPEPIQNGTRTFAEACAEERANYPKAE